MHVIPQNIEDNQTLLPVTGPIRIGVAKMQESCGGSLVVFLQRPNHRLNTV